MYFYGSLLKCLSIVLSWLFNLVSKLHASDLNFFSLFYTTNNSQNQSNLWNDVHCQWGSPLIFDFIIFCVLFLIKISFLHLVKIYRCITHENLTRIRRIPRITISQYCAPTFAYALCRKYKLCSHAHFQTHFQNNTIIYFKRSPWLWKTYSPSHQKTKTV